MTLAFSAGRDIASVGHHFFIGLQPGAALTDHDKRLLSALRPAGVILFKRNFEAGLGYDDWLERHARLITDVRGCVGRDELFIAIDHEGGSIVRPPRPITVFPQAADWTDRSFEVAEAMGTELASLGVNVSFAPVLDVDSNPKNPVIGRRAFGTTPPPVIESACRFVDGIERAGVLACGKHFPGHGDTETDSHFELPVLDADLATIRARELVPFEALVRHGIGMIMTAHILFPRIEPETPATMSRDLIEGVLRREMGFDGVVTSDDIGMHAVSRLFESPEATVRTINAGCDLIMVCSHRTDTARAYGFAEAILDGLRRGEIAEATLAASFERVERLLARAPCHAVRRLPDETLAGHAALAEAIRNGAPEHYPASVV